MEDSAQTIETAFEVNCVLQSVALAEGKNDPNFSDETFFPPLNAEGKQ